MRRWIIGLLMLIGVIGAGSYARAQDLTVNEMAELRQAMEASMKELFEPGNAIPGWETDGADLLAALADQPGGLKANALLATDREGAMSATFHGSTLADIAIPKTWSTVVEKGAVPPRTSDVSTFIMPLDGPFFIAAESSVIRRGKAICGRGLGHYRIYRVPGLPKGELPEPVALMMADMIDTAMGDRVLCETYEPITGGFRVRAVNGDGRSLPTIDAQEPDVVHIVPRKPIEEMLFPPKAG